MKTLLRSAFLKPRDHKEEGNAHSFLLQPDEHDKLRSYVEQNEQKLSHANFVISQKFIHLTK